MCCNTSRVEQSLKFKEEEQSLGVLTIISTMIVIHYLNHYDSWKTHTHTHTHTHSFISAKYPVLINTDIKNLMSSISLYQFARATITQQHNLDNLKGYIRHFPFWRLEMGHQVFSRSILPLRVLGKDVFQTPLQASGVSLAYGCITPVSTQHSLCMFVYVQIFFL